MELQIKRSSEKLAEIANLLSDAGVNVLSAVYSGPSGADTATLSLTIAPPARK